MNYLPFESLRKGAGLLDQFQTVLLTGPVRIISY